MSRARYRAQKPSAVINSASSLYERHLDRFSPIAYSYHGAYQNFSYKYCNNNPPSDNASECYGCRSEDTPTAMAGHSKPHAQSPRPLPQYNKTFTTPTKKPLVTQHLNTTLKRLTTTNTSKVHDLLGLVDANFWIVLSG